MGDSVDPDALAWAAKFSNVPAAAPGAATDPNTGQTTAGDTNVAPPADPSGVPPTADPTAPPLQEPPPAPVVAPVSAGGGSGDPGTAPDPNPQTTAGQNDPPPTGTDAPKKINVTLVTAYGQSVRYWVQDRAIDANNEAPEGAGTVLVDGEDHGPGESIALTCIETANGASICYRRESNPNPPGGGMMPWSSVTISDGGTFTINETAQPLGNPPPPADPPAGDPPAGQITTADGSTPPAALPTSAPTVSDPGTTTDPTQQTTAGQNDPPPTGTDAPKKINVTLVTAYGQTVRYWIQDRAIDANNEAPEGAGTVLVDGEDHGPGESIALTCIETANGASICYRRESNPNPPGGGMMPWSSVTISDGGTFTINETAQPLGNPPPPADPPAGDPPAGQITTADGSTPPAALPTSATTVSDPGTTTDPTQQTTAGQNDPPPTGTDAPKKINVTLVTAYGQSVRYWVQDRAIDANNEAPEGAGTVLVDGEDHGPGESIALTCIETANGASICYRRESNPNPPGGGMMPWSSVTISDGGTFTINETAQPLGNPPPPADPPAGDPPGDQTPSGDGTAAPMPAGEPANEQSPGDPSADLAVPMNVPLGAPSGVPVEELTTGKESAVTRADAESAIYTYLARALSDQGSQTLRITTAVRTAIVRIGAADPALAGKLDSYLGRKQLPGSPRELAAAIAGLLPDALPAAAIAHLPRAATTDSNDAPPKSAGDAAGKGVAEYITPTVRKLQVDRSIQDKIIDIARSGTPDAITAGINKLLDSLPLDDKLRAMMEAILAGAVKQGSAPMDRQQDGAGSPYANPPPPSVAPDPPKAPGETIIPGPKMRFDIPGVKPPPKAEPPPKPQAADATAMASVITSIDDACLVPASVKGTPAAGDYAHARDVARDIANQMDQARRAKHGTMTYLLGTQFPSSDETWAAMDQLQAIVEKIGAALPDRGAPLGRVLLQIAPPQGTTGGPVQRAVSLHNGS